MNHPSPTQVQEPRPGLLDALAVRAYTVEEFCRMFRVCRTRFYQLWRDKEIAPRKLGGRTVVPVEEAERWFQSLPTAAPNDTSDGVQ